MTNVATTLLDITLIAAVLPVAVVALCDLVEWIWAAPRRRR